MAFTSMKLKPESGANQIKSADDAYSFMAHMRLSYQNKPHWHVARQALNHAGASDASEIQAWRTFRSAAAAEGWLLDQESAPIYLGERRCSLDRLTRNSSKAFFPANCAAASD